MPNQNGTTTTAKTPAYGTSIKGSLGTLVDEGSATLGTIRARAHDAYAKGSDVLDRTIALVKANPLRSVAIVIGAGYVLMRIKRSPLTPLVLIGGIGYQLLRRERAAGVHSMRAPRIGADLDSGTIDGFLLGGLADIRMYDRVLSAAELAQLATP